MLGPSCFFSAFFFRAGIEAAFPALDAQQATTPNLQRSSSASQARASADLRNQMVTKTSPKVHEKAALFK
jgi:hypothetical protein